MGNKHSRKRSSESDHEHRTGGETPPPPSAPATPKRPPREGPKTGMRNATRTRSRDEMVKRSPTTKTRTTKKQQPASDKKSSDTTEDKSLKRASTPLSKRPQRRRQQPNKDEEKMRLPQRERKESGEKKKKEEVKKEKEDKIENTTTEKSKRRKTKEKKTMEEKTQLGDDFDTQEDATVTSWKPTRKLMSAGKEEKIGKMLEEILAKGVEGALKEYDDVIKKKLPSKEEVEASTFSRYRDKNRYFDIPCLEETRVKLEESEGGMDYIHANYCGLPSKNKQFICTQGPKDETRIEFWSMVWQEQAEFIIMLCNIEEKGRKKCAEYFPSSVGQSVSFGDYSITCTSLSTLRFDKPLALRKFTLSKANEANDHEVEHIHWEAWPDHGVPAVDNTIFQLMDKVRKSGPPVVVHCSAGVGRSGTVVATELTTASMSQGETATVGGVVEGLRGQRAIAVQTREQYLFLNRLIFDHFKTSEIAESAVGERFVEEYEAYILKSAKK